MKRVILILATLMALILFAQSESSIHLGGRDGAILLGELTNNSINTSAGNNTPINISHNATTMKLGGDDGTKLLEDLTNESLNATDGRNISNNLSDWGSKLPVAPLPPKYDYKTAQMIEVIRMNHLGY